MGLPNLNESLCLRFFINADFDLEDFENLHFLVNGIRKVCIILVSVGTVFRMDIKSDRMVFICFLWFLYIY